VAPALHGVFPMPVPAFLMRALHLHLRDKSLDAEDPFRGFRPSAPVEAGGAARERSEAGRADLGSLSEALELASALGAGPALALEMGANTPLQALGMFGELIGCSANMRAALGSARRFLPVLRSGGEIRLKEAGPLAIVHFEPGTSNEHERRFAIEMALSMMVSIGRSLLGKTIGPKQVLIPHGAPKYFREYTKFFRCPVVFDADSAALVFDQALLDLPQPLADDYLRAVLEAELERTMRCELPQGPLYERVRAILERDSKLLMQNTLRILPRRLGLTPRAVRRRLAAEGLTLSGVVREFRKEQAIHLVVDFDLPLKSIADRVGFSDSTSFHRAFKRWTGATPKEFRRRHQLSANAA
jgi:AraC-like DNA-binding protein